MSSIRPDEAPPDWYLAGLIARYQYLSDELCSLTVRGSANIETILCALFLGLLALFAFDSTWAGLLFFALWLLIQNSARRQRRYLIAAQMLQIEAEFPLVKENVAAPRGSS